MTLQFFSIRFTPTKPIAMIMSRLIQGTILATSFFAISFSVSAQSGSLALDETPYLDHEVLVMFQQHVSGEEGVEILGRFLDIEVLGVPSPSSKIYHLHVAGENWQASLQAMRENRAVKAVQLNHEVYERATTPNDPGFGQQWHHVQSGDHDIDSDEAWDITTGGSTAGGTPIVVAVLEGGGSNYNHTDLIDNHWTNAGEIPNNGIDDDNNGYVDDYDGWNVGSGNDAIGTGGHGTSVSGMIGAKGNNNNGGAGVNWDVDIMQVDMAGGLSEANVIAAYEYPKVMRDLFNASGGSDGAFVVATNASWGIDQANPANYPVWCAYYDDLGASGILNCGATANSSWNIDVVGDMPTGCSSDYMVAVTATNSSDVRTFSGYGTTTIDLGAPGESVYLPSGSSGYGNTSGTSFASPCVAGAIAMVYSAPCPDLEGLAISNPSAAADLVRGYIFDGVDPVSNLANEVATGGRLNVHNALELALASCVPQDCEIESVTAVSECYYDEASGTVANEVTISVAFLDEGCSASSVCLENLDADETTCTTPNDWGSPLDETNSITLSGLEPGTAYSLIVYSGDYASDALVFTSSDCSDIIPGCTDSEACNYAPEATVENGTCTYPTELYGCDGLCLNDADGDGVCDELEIAGCTDAEACNYTGDTDGADTLYFAFADTVPLEWTVPAVDSIHIILRGARGSGANAGNGAIIEGDLAVTPGEILLLYVGGMGTGTSGGFNGGGIGGTANNDSNAGGGGGGATDVRVAPYGLEDRLLVAAGGGGQGGGNTDGNGGFGGCEAGEDGESPFGTGGGGGSLTEGGIAGTPWIGSGNPGIAGEFGLGGAGGIDPCYNVGPGGGGGGGYYGGGGGGTDCFASGTLGGGGGGGGSSFYPADFSCIAGGNDAHGSIEIIYFVAFTDDTCDYSCNCLGDLNDDGAVTVADVLVLLSGFGCAIPDDCPSDANGDGFTNVEDLLVVLSVFGTECE